MGTAARTPGGQVGEAPGASAPHAARPGPAVRLVGAARDWAQPRAPQLAVALVALAVGAALRAFVLRSALGVPDFDEATVAVQAERFTEGRLAAFFPNQPYGGTLETGLVAVAFTLFGSSTFVLKAVPMALALVAAHLGWRVARRVVPGRLGQWSVPVLLWCAPAAGVLQSTKERGFYGVALVLAMASVLLALRLAEAPTRRDLALLGLVMGLGWWSTPLVMLVAVPAVAWLVARRPPIVAAALPAVAAALVGAAPWLAWNVRNGWASLDPVPTLGTTWGERLGDWFVRLPVAAGAEAPWVDGRRVLPWPLVTRALVVAGVAVASARTWRRAPGLLPTLVAGYALLYACNGLALGAAGDPRYMYLLVPILALCVGALLPDPPAAAPRRAARRLAATLAVVGASAALGLWALWGTRAFASRHDAPRYVNSQGIEAVARLLDDRDVGTALTDAAGTQVMFFTDGRVVAGSFDVPRFRSAERAARADETSTYVLDALDYGNADRLEAWLAGHAVPYERHDIGRWRVFLLPQRVLPEEAGLRTFLSGGGVSE